jgi:3-carboxy-cis,cis-muconate cycloisomerase
MFDALFTDPDVDQIFTDQAVIAAMLRFEGALVQAQADLNIISAEPADLIAHVCLNAQIDADKIVASARDAGNPAIPLVRELSELVSAADPEAAKFVHNGATSQDVIDSAVMLQLKPALIKIELGIEQLQQRLVHLIGEHRGTVMIGRTLLQQARPITFAFKLANWLDQLTRGGAYLREVRTRALVLQFGGAVGTLAASGQEALSVLSRLAARLELAEPTIPWHTARDRFFEVCSACARLSGCLGKMASDVALLMQTEVGELSERAEEGRGGSSAMPHKRNPIAPTMIVAACTRVPGLLATMAATMTQEQERAVGRWHAEWGPLTEIVRLAGGAIRQSNDLFSRLEVHSARMLENLELTQGSVYAEEVAVILAKQMGKLEADRLVKRACLRANEKGCHLRDVLAWDPNVTNVLDQAGLDLVFRPENALGIANELIDRVLRGTIRQVEPEKTNGLSEPV